MERLLNLLAIDNEGELSERLNSLSVAQCEAAIQLLKNFLEINDIDLKFQLLRILIERARPMMLPAQIWSMSLSSSDPIRGVIRQYLVSQFGSSDIDECWVDGLENLCRNFQETRQRVRLNDQMLIASNFKCYACGYLFSDEDLSDSGFELPDPLKLRHNNFQVDSMHPISVNPNNAKPTVEHIWPVSVYGGNSAGNLKLACFCCNNGKSNFVTYAHTGPNVGIFLKKHLGEMIVSTDVFFSVMARDGCCQRCGAAPAVRPLSVKKRRMDWPLVSDNLFAICHDCIE